MAAAAAVSCDDDELVAGTPVIDVVAQDADAFFGDSLPFTINASDLEVDLSTLTAELYYGEELVSSTTIRTKVSGSDYTGKIFVPYLKDTPNGTATLKYILQNVNMTTTEMETELALERPDFSYVTLVTDDAEYTMSRTSLYNYSATEEFPAEVDATIVTPAYGDNGNELTFGWNGSEIELDGSKSIPFTSTGGGEYEITFNSLTFEASPFASVTLNDEEMTAGDTDGQYVYEGYFTNGQTLTFSGLVSMDEWWIDPDYLETQTTGTYTFLPISGYYRITADTNLNYFIVEVIDSSGELVSLQSDGTGALWVIGEGLGKPSVSENPVGWTTENALCMAPVSSAVYQLTLTGGVTVSTSSINFKFYGGAKSWDDEVLSSALTTSSDIVFVGDGDNGRDDGNLGLTDGTTLSLGTVYRFTVDMTAGKSAAVLTVEVVGTEDLDTEDITIGGVEFEQTDASNYQATLSLTQGETLAVTGISDLDSWYVDPDYLEISSDGLTFLPLDGTYLFTVNTALSYISCLRMDGDDEATLDSDGNGAIWLMGWGVGSPSQDYQFGWTPGEAYCMAEISDKVYQFTGYAGPETGSSIGQRFRTDYLSFKFFFQDGWGDEFSDDNALTIIAGSEYITDNGNFELTDGVTLTEGALYRITIDLTAGVSAGTISFTQL